MDIEKLNRIVVVGTSCSGKTTFACELAGKLDKPHIELDTIQWGPNWTATPLPEFRKLVSAAVEPESWIADGNYSSVRDIVWPRATTLIWLNYPFHVVGRRALSRTFRRVVTREVIFSGNVETLRTAVFSKDSMLWWVAKTYNRRRREYPLLFQQPEHRHLQVIELTSPAQAERCLGDIGRNSDTPVRTTEGSIT